MRETRDILGAFQNLRESGAAGVLASAPRVTRNPFRRVTGIHFALSTKIPVRLEIFDVQGRRLTRLIEFHRQVRADLEIRESDPDAGDLGLLHDLQVQLREVANDIRIDGLVIVTDLGDDLHKRLLGIKPTEDG